MVSLVGLIGLGITGYAMLQSSEFQKELDSASKSSAGQQSPGAKPQIPVMRFMIGSLAMYGVPLLAGFVMGITVLWALLCRATAEWFRVARELRHEHHQARMMLSA